MRRRGRSRDSVTPVGVSRPLPVIVTIVEPPFREVRTRSMVVAAAGNVAGSAAVSGARHRPRSATRASERDARQLTGVKEAVGDVGRGRRRDRRCRRRHRRGGRDAVQLHADGVPAAPDLVFGRACKCDANAGHAETVGSGGLLEANAGHHALGLDPRDRVGHGGVAKIDDQRQRVGTVDGVGHRLGRLDDDRRSLRGDTQRAGRKRMPRSA